MLVAIDAAMVPELNWGDVLVGTDMMVQPTWFQQGEVRCAVW